MELAAKKKAFPGENSPEFQEMLDNLGEDLQTLNEVTTMVSLHLDARTAWQVMLGLRIGAEAMEGAPECQLTCDRMATVIEDRLPLTKGLKGVASRITDVEL